MKNIRTSPRTAAWGRFIISKDDEFDLMLVHVTVIQFFFGSPA